MKKKLKKSKNYWRLGILLFSVSLLLWNCQKEDHFGVVPTENNLQHKKISSHSLEDLQNDFIFKETSTNFGLLPELHATNNLKSKGNNSYVIDTKSIKKISKNNYTSYTFIVDRASNPKDVIENLVIEKKSDTIRGYFIKYKLDPDYLDKLSRGEKASFKASIKRTPYQNNITELLSLINNPPKNLHARERLCFYQTTVVIKKCDSDKQHSPGEVCHEKGDRRPGYIYYTNLVCYGVSTGGGSGNPWGDDSDSSYDDLGNGNYEGGEDNNDGSESTPNIACNDPIHGCDKKAIDIADKLQVEDFLLENLSDYTLSKLDEIATLKEELTFIINKSNFDPLNDSWLNQLRKFGRSIYNLKSLIPKELFDELVKQLDHNLKVAIKKVAKDLFNNADVRSEADKEYEFKNNGENGAAILLYEFATGTGKDVRNFDESYDITKKMLAGNVLKDIKADFLKRISANGLTFNDFVNKGDKIDGGYSFSPDHTTIKDSFNKHLNANWVQFIIGGASAKYSPSSTPGYILVELSNDTSRKSLILHMADNYKRDGTGNNKPLSTIRQIFRFKIKIN